MATRNHKPGPGLHPTKTTPAPQADSEAPWQQLMVFNYVLFEAIDAMEQERATGRHTPLNQSWQQFIHHLRRQKPTLGPYLDNWVQQVGRPL